MVKAMVITLWVRDLAYTRPLQKETSSLLRAQKAKRLKAVYEKLSCECFFDDQIESALGALQDTATFETALEWLCLNLPLDDLPLKFANASSLHAYKESKAKRDDDSLDSLEPSQADWIRQYMEKEEERFGSAEPLEIFGEQKCAFDRFGGHLKDINDALELFKASELVIDGDNMFLQKQNSWSRSFLTQQNSRTKALS
ncbi:hypothetical protein Droror1_Dr00024883 [Drosera rotundifolia]